MRRREGQRDPKIRRRLMVRHTAVPSFRSAQFPSTRLEHVLFYRTSKETCIPCERWVTSSCLCKKSEGAVLPLLVESVKNRIDDSLHAGHIHEQHHGPGTSSDFHEAAFDRIGGAQFAPQRLREIEKR